MSRLPHRRWTRLCQGLGAAGVGFLLASAFTPLPTVLGRALGGDSPQLEPAEAIVVLGTELRPDGTLTNTSLRRTIHGILLFRQGLAPILVFLGPPRAGGGRAEAEVRAELARELGVAREAVLTDAQAWTTREEAERVWALLGPRSLRRILLVTEAQHIPRARAVFERAGFTVLAAPADGLGIIGPDPEARLRLMRDVLEEWLARLYYRAAGYL